MVQLTVATINLRNRQDRWRQRRHLLVGQLVDAAPDLLSLQEISFPIRQGHWLRQQINMRLSGNGRQPYRLIQRRKKHWYYGYHEGIGVLTKLPVAYHDSINLGYNGRLALRVSIELPTRKHLDFVAVHLHHISYDHEARLEQTMKLVGWLNEQRRLPYQVIAGDFNELPHGLAIQMMKQGYHSAVADAWGREPLATFPTALVQPTPPRDGSMGLGWSGCLDYIFLSGAIPPAKTAVIFCNKPDSNDDTLYPSDHVGLLATIEV